MTSRTKKCSGRTGIGFPLYCILPMPLSDAGATSTGKDKASYGLENTNVAIALDSGADLLRSWSNHKLALKL